MRNGRLTPFPKRWRDGAPPVARCAARAIAAFFCSAVPALLAVGAGGCDGGKSQAGGPPAWPPAAVAVVRSMQRDVPVYLDEIGRCAAHEVVMVVPQVAGRVTGVHYTEGGDVKEGDLLVEIDSRPFAAAVKQADATLAQVHSQLELARLEFNRAQSLVGIKATSPQDFDSKKSAVAVNEALVQAGEAALDTAKLNLEYCQIKSPIDGRAGQRLIDVGNVVKANEGTLLVIQRQDPIYADFTIAENDLSAVRSNMARGTLKTLVWTPADGANAAPPGAGGGSPAPATAPSTQPAVFPSSVPPSARTGALTFLDNAVQDGSGTIKLRASLANADRHFWPGQFVWVRLVLDEAKGAVLVPATATQVGQKGPFVYVVTEKSTAKLCPVVVGQRQGEWVVIRKGVEPGDRVVTDGQLAVTPDGPVRVDSEDGVPVAPPAAANAGGAAPAAKGGKS